MNFYVIFTFLIGLLILARLKDKGLEYFLFFLLFVLSSFRGQNVGADTIAYLDKTYIAAHSEIDSSLISIEGWGSQVELLTRLLYKLITNLDLDPRFVLIIFSFVTLLFFSKAIQRFKVNLAFALVFYVVLGFYFRSFNIARQLCSVSILLYSFSYLQERGIKQYFFFIGVVLATLIQSFSIIFALVYFFKFIPRLSKHTDIILFVISLILVTQKLEFIEQWSSLIDIEHVSYLIDTFGDDKLTVFGIINHWINLSILFYFYYRYKSVKTSTSSHIVENMYIISFLVYSVMVNYGLLNRFMVFITIIQCVLLSSFFADTSIKKTSLDKVVYFIMIIVYSFNNRIFDGSGEFSYYIEFF